MRNFKTDASGWLSVAARLSSSDSDEATVLPATLTFTAANGDVPQTVSLTGVTDNLVDGTQTLTITVSVVDASSDDRFEALADQTVSVSTIDAGVGVVLNLTINGGTGDNLIDLRNVTPTSQTR